MKHKFSGVAFAAMVLLAGCSSKSTISPADQAGAGSGSGAGAGSGAGVSAGADAVAGPVLSDIFYDFDSSALSPEAQEQLKQNAAWLKKNTAQSVTIEGHCDERGTDEYNIALGERRANSAKEYLTNLGVGSSKLTVVSYGEERPFDPAHNEEAWSKNRRSHFVTK
ncbi:MAG: peptidoglycan-associated lipoprotein Pal [Chlorobiaceae bacterium]|nr:peptidoglycan-associated lipoprotein Pal [Chlorobiaceae bacterium]